MAETARIEIATITYMNCGEKSQYKQNMKVDF
jgi:hypothetical protein